MRPRPARTRNSAAKLPTPPTPTTSTLAWISSQSGMRASWACEEGGRPACGEPYDDHRGHCSYACEAFMAVRGGYNISLAETRSAGRHAVRIDGDSADSGARNCRSPRGGQGFCLSGASMGLPLTCGAGRRFQPTAGFVPARDLHPRWFPPPGKGFRKSRCLRFCNDSLYPRTIPRVAKYQYLSTEPKVN